MPSSKRADRAPYDSLWKISDRLRGSVDAAQYKVFVLGLVFLKYISDTFAERRAADPRRVPRRRHPRRERIDVFLDDKDEYTREGVLWVPNGARWDGLAAHAESEGMGQLVDNAMNKGHAVQSIVTRRRAAESTTGTTPTSGVLASFST